MRAQELVLEKIILRDDYIVALNPTVTEFNANFPDGAAGVLLTDGTLVVGDGEALDHLLLLRLAGFDYKLEKYRLQIMGKILVELWDELDDLPEDFSEDDITVETVEQFSRFPRSVREQIARDLQMARSVQRLRRPIRIVLRDPIGFGLDDGIWLQEDY